MNTLVTYFYYSKPNERYTTELVLNGALSKNQIATILTNCMPDNVGFVFVPEALGLPVSRGENHKYDRTKDHPYAYFSTDIHMMFRVTRLDHTTGLTPEQFTNLFINAGGKWEMLAAEQDLVNAGILTQDLVSNTGAIIGNTAVPLDIAVVEAAISAVRQAGYGPDMTKSICEQLTNITNTVADAIARNSTSHHPQQRAIDVVTTLQNILRNAEYLDSKTRSAIRDKLNDILKSLKFTDRQQKGDVTNNAD